MERLIVAKLKELKATRRLVEEKVMIKAIKQKYNGEHAELTKTRIEIFQLEQKTKEAHGDATRLQREISKLETKVRRARLTAIRPTRHDGPLCSLQPLL